MKGKLRAILIFEYDADTEDYGVDTLLQAAASDVDMGIYETIKSRGDYAEAKDFSIVPVFDPPIQYADVAELRADGVIQEVNRLFLHPLGLALEVMKTKAGEHISGVWDYRDDPEGIAYDEGYSQFSPEKAQALAEEIERRGPARMAALGYVIQPVSVEYKQLVTRILEPVMSREPAAVGEWDEGEESAVDVNRERQLDEDEVKERDMTEAEIQAYADDPLRDAA